MGIILQITVWW